MKKIVGLITLVVSTGIQAAPDRDIYDLMYLPDAGTAYGSTYFGFGAQKLEADNSAFDVDVDGFEIGQNLGYALTDRFSLDLDLEYRDSEADPKNGDKYDAAKGLSDPTLTARFRTVDEAFRWDVVGGVSVAFQDQKVDRSGDRNNSDGGHSFFIGTELGTKTENVQWVVGAAFIRNLEATTEYETAGRDVEVEDDANNALSVHTALHHRLHEKNFLRWSAQAYFTEKVGNDREDVISESAPSSNYEFGLQYQYLASEDLLVRIGGDYQIFNTQSGQIDNYHGWDAYIGASYQF